MCTPRITELQKEILLNTDILAINQDVTPQGRPVVVGDISIWARMLTGGDVVVALYNEDDTTKEFSFEFETLSVAGRTNYSTGRIENYMVLSNFVATNTEGFVVGDKGGDEEGFIDVVVGEGEGEGEGGDRTWGWRR